MKGDGPLEVGAGPIRTGCTVILPRSHYVRQNPVYAGSSRLNGNGEMTGLEWVRESGLLATAIGLTNTHSVGTVRDALVADEAAQGIAGKFWSMPVVGETWDGLLNDVDGQHVTSSHVREALASCESGPVLEGSVGGGTGMICHEFKGGIGTSSRVVDVGDGRYTVGALVQANQGRRRELRIDGIPIGRFEEFEHIPIPYSLFDNGTGGPPAGSGSIIVVIATDAPLLADQCARLATRAALGIGRVGAGTADSSGDLAIAFATGNDLPTEAYLPGIPHEITVRTLTHQHIDPLLEAAADATEEAIVNAMLAADSMVGRDGVTAHALDHEALSSVLGTARCWPNARWTL